MWGMLVALYRKEGGNMAIMMALALPLLLGVAALAVDEAALYTQQRRLQAAVDLAAIHAAGDPSNALARAHAALIDARVVDASLPLGALLPQAGGPLRVTVGHYRADPSLAVSLRFVTDGQPTNAARVELSQMGQLHFARAFTDQAPLLRAAAVASATPEAAFSIGSRLASLDGGLANAVLGGLLGTTLSLSLADYQALAALDIDLLRFMDALAGRAGITAGTYGAVLDQRLRLADIATALAVAAGGSDPAAIDLLLGLGTAINDGIFVEMARLIALDGLADLALGSMGAGAQATINALELLSVSALLADGQRQVALALGVGLPGLLGVDVRLVAGEPPQAAWYAMGGPGTFVRTAQVRLKLTLSVLGNGGAGIGALGITLPVYAELAFAEARLTALHCPPGRPHQGVATIAARPGVLRLAVGQTPEADFLDTRKPLALQRVALVTVLGIAQVTARAHVEMAQTQPVALQFTHADMLNGTKKTVTTTTPVAALSASLLANLDLRLEIIGVNLLGGLLNGLTGTVQAALTPVAPAIDATLVTLLTLLGLSVGEADIRLNGLNCRAAALVQ